MTKTPIATVPSRQRELRARVIMSLTLAALLPTFAMDLLVVNGLLFRVGPGSVEALVIVTGLVAAAVGMALGWVISGVVVGYANERVKEVTARLLDVTRRLEQEHERVTLAMEGSRLAIWDLDLATGEVHLSPNWSAMMGGEGKECTIPIAQLIERVPAEEQETCWNAVRAVLRRKAEYYDVEHRVHRDDGSILWIRSRGNVSERDADGKALRMTGTNFDVTKRKLAEAALLESEGKLRLVADNLPLMIAYVDTDLRYLFANRRYIEFFGRSLEEILGSEMRTIAGVEAHAVVRSRLPELSEGSNVMYERERPNRDGDMRNYEVQLIPQRSEGALKGIFIVIQDVTEERDTQRRLSASARALQLITDGVPAMISHVGTDGRILFANRPYRDYRGMAGLDPLITAADVAPDTWEAMANNLQRLEAGEDVIYDRAESGGASERHFEVRLVPQRGARGNLESVFVLENEITERAMATRALAQMALTDSLTGLPNKRLLLDRLDRAIAQAGRRDGDVALLFVDLDGFKAVNDNYGHAAGDKVLHIVAARLRNCARASDTVARLGGDEFVVLLEGCRSPSDAEQVAAKIARALSQPCDLGKRQVDVSCSIGIALHGGEGGVESLLR
ncbi:MAG: diguanylate cyclase domain-containing protein, partial [Bacillota bacterium]